MAPIRRFSATEKGKAPREGPDPLPPKKRLALCHRVEGAHQEVSRPWCERPPPGFPLPLYAHIEGSEGVDVERHERRRRRRRVTKARDFCSCEEPRIYLVGACKVSVAPFVNMILIVEWCEMLIPF